MIKRQNGIGMNYKKLIFEELSEEKTEATLLLKQNHKVTVSFDLNTALHDCELRNHSNNLIDSEEGLDTDGVESFIERSKDYVQEYIEILNDTIE